MRCVVCNGISYSWCIIVHCICLEYFSNWNLSNWLEIHFRAILLVITMLVFFCIEKSLDMRLTAHWKINNMAVRWRASQPLKHAKYERSIAIFKITANCLLIAFQLLRIPVEQVHNTIQSMIINWIENNFVALFIGLTLNLHFMLNEEVITRSNTQGFVRISSWICFFHAQLKWNTNWKLNGFQGP